MTKKLKKMYSWKKFDIFKTIVAIYLNLGLLKGRQRYRRSLSSLQPENIQPFKTWTFLTFLYFCRSPLPFWIRSGSKTLHYVPAHCLLIFLLILCLMACTFPRIFMLWVCYSFCIPSFEVVVFLWENLPVYFQGDGPLGNGRRSLTRWWASHFSRQSKLQVGFFYFFIDSTFFTRQLYIKKFLLEMHS